MQSELHNFRLRALIDTGSPNTLFDRGVADALGLEIGKPGAQVENVHLLGGVHKAERFHVVLMLPPFDDITWEAAVLFLREELDVAFAGLLGTEGFLDRWVVSFNYYDNYFVVEERDSFVGRMPTNTYEAFQAQFDSEWAPPGT